jgi:hypothetical protein
MAAAMRGELADQVILHTVAIASVVAKLGWTPHLGRLACSSR